MVGGTGIYVTWVTGAIIASLVLMPFLKPPWARITLTGFQDMFRRYWMHGIVVFSIYIWKDIFDGIDRIHQHTLIHSVETRIMGRLVSRDTGPVHLHPGDSVRHTPGRSFRHVDDPRQEAAVL